MYVDSAYLAKFYLNEVDSSPVRRLLMTADSLVSSAWAFPEVVCAFHRKLREGLIEPAQHSALLRAFQAPTAAGLWTLIPLSDRISRRVAAVVATLPAAVYLRSGDDAHLATAADQGASETWSTDRHLLAAAPYFG